MIEATTIPPVREADDAAASLEPPGDLSNASALPQSANRILRWAGPVLLVWAPMLLWFAAFRPGLMSNDSIDVWRQATEGWQVDFHSPVYTAAMWVSASLTNSPALLTLAQSFLLATGITALARSVIALGAPRRVTIVVTALLALSPPVGGFAVSLWKDVPYSACVLLITARVVDLARAELTKNETLARRSISLMAPAAVGVAVLRQNGVVLLVMIVLASALLFRRRWRRLALVGLTATAALALLKLLVYPALDVIPAEARWTVGPFLGDIAAVAAAEPDLIDGDDRRSIEAVAPVEVWGSAFTRWGGCRSLGWQHDREQFDWRAVNKDPGRYRAIALRLATEAPGRVVGNHLCQGAIAWRPNVVGVYSVGRGIDANAEGLSTEPLYDGLNRLGVDLLDFVDKPNVQWFAWRAPIWIYAAIAAAAVAAWRERRIVLLAVVTPLIAQQISVIAINFTQDARYMAASLFAAPILITLGLRTPARRDDDNEVVTATEATTSVEGSVSSCSRP